MTGLELASRRLQEAAPLTRAPAGGTPARGLERSQAEHSPTSSPAAGLRTGTERTSSESAGIRTPSSGSKASRPKPPPAPRAPARTRKVAGGEGRAPGRPRGRAGGTCQQFDLVSQHLHLRAAASGSALGRAGRGAREARSEAAGEPGARQAELPGARSALTAPLAALPPPKRVKKIHQLHDRAPLKGARRHLVGVSSGRRRERAGWVRVTLSAAAGGGPRLLSP